jgi:hypothetical protein
MIPAPEPHLISVEAVPPFGLRLRFEDGVVGVVDLEGELGATLKGPMYEPLRDPGYFARVRLDEDGAPAWPNGLDLAPDALYEDLLSAVAR